MKDHPVAQANESGRERGPLTNDEVLARDNIPASEPIPADVAERFGRRSIFLLSDDEDYDPRKDFTRVEGSRGTWELSTRAPVVGGLRVERAERVERGSMRQSGEASALESFRPPWQPYVYHPKMVATESRPRALERKNGAKVRPDTIFNTDDRQLFYPEGYPWHCVGKLIVSTANAPPSSSGTGTLVGARTVLTSSHVIPWGAPGLTIMFVPAFWVQTLPWLLGQPGLPAPLRGLSSFATHVRGYREGQRTAYDLAVIRLQQPLGDGLGFFGCRVYDDDWEDDPRWTLVGYPGLVGVTTGPSGITGYNNNGNMPSRQFGISVEDDDSDEDGLELEHRGDTTPGNSGGPLFGQWPNGPAVIGVHSGSMSDADSVAAGGRAMRDLVSWARTTWA